MTLAEPPFVPLLQSDIAARALRLLDRDARLRALPCGARALAVQCRLPVIGALGVTTRGPLFETGTPAEARIAALRTLKLHLVNAADADAGIDLHAAGFRQVMTPATVAILPTRASLPEQLALASTEWRGAARQGLDGEASLSMRRFEPSRDRWLLDRDRVQQRERGFRAAGADFALALARAAPADVWIALAERTRRPVAGMLFVRHEGSATYHVGWSGEDGRRLRAHPALLAMAAVRLCAMGVRELELGTLDTVRSPGLARFKLGSGARAQRLGGTWIRLPV